jgi:hypothetical protein
LTQCSSEKVKHSPDSQFLSGVRGAAPDEPGDPEIQAPAGHPDGQPEPDKILSDQRFRQLRQRISVRYHLNPLDRNQTDEYIQHRLKVAGSKGESIFDPEAVRLIWKFSKGIPRVVNTLCDGALMIGHATSRNAIDGQTAKETIRDMGYLGPKAATFFRKEIPFPKIESTFDPESMTRQYK